MSKRDSNGRFVKGHKVPKKWREAVSKVDRRDSKHPNWKGGKEYYLRKQAKNILRNAGLDIKGKIIHHKDDNIRNNSIENLQIMTNSEHAKYHYEKGDYSIGKFTPR